MTGMVLQKQPFRGVLRKRCSENKKQIYRKTPMPKCDFNKVAKQFTLTHGCSPINLLHIFRTSFLKNTSGGLFLVLKVSEYLFLHEIKNTVFLHKTIEKPYLNLHFKFHDFFPENNEDMKILSFGFFSFRT